VHFEEHSPDSRNEIMRDTVIREIADLVPDDYKVADQEDPTCFTLTSWSATSRSFCCPTQTAVI
jgi:hypothetical protein